MKQAILITAYKSFDHLLDIIDFFDDSFEIYIHIDRKSEVSQKTIEQITVIKKVKLLSQKYTVNWGGRNHLKSYLLLAEEALKNPSIHYFHLISGQDFPAKDLPYFKNFLEHAEKRDYITHFEMPTACWDNGGMNRVEYYNLFDLFDAKKNGKWIQRFINLQKKNHFKRSLSNNVPKLYGGDTCGV